MPFGTEDTEMVSRMLLAVLMLMGAWDWARAANGYIRPDWDHMCIDFDEKCDMVDLGRPCFNGEIIIHKHPECMSRVLIRDDSPDSYLLCGHKFCE